MTRYTVGTILRLKPQTETHSTPNGPYQMVRREIVEVRDSGYSWKYPELGEKTPAGGDNLFLSEESNDPFMEMEWEVESKPMRGGSQTLIHCDPDAGFGDQH